MPAKVSMEEKEKDKESTRAFRINGLQIDSKWYHWLMKDIEVAREVLVDRCCKSL